MLDRYTIYNFSDEAIVKEICRKVKTLRRSSCVSQQELSERSEVSIASIKRIEAGTITIHAWHSWHNASIESFLICWKNP